MDAGIGRTLTALTAIALAAIALTASAAQASPRVLSARFEQGAVAGVPLDFQLRAIDRSAPVSGMVVGFGPGGGFGLSSCALDATGRVLSPPGPVSLSAPATFPAPGRQALSALVTSGGCSPGATSTLQSIVADVVRRGQAPTPLLLTSPLSPAPGLPAPQLPGLGAVPLPPLPALPGVIESVAKRCPGAANKVRNTAASLAKARRSLLCLNNYERRRRGIRPMRANRRLTRAAVGHSRRMVRRRFFSHVGPGSLGVSSRLRRSHYLPRRGGTWLVGENIGFGRGRAGTPLGIHRAWMRSTPHRANILRPSFREVGFGVFGGVPFGRRGVTYTADFGRVRR